MRFCFLVTKSNSLLGRNTCWRHQPTWHHREEKERMAQQQRKKQRATEEKESLTRIAIVSKDKCKPKKCALECKAACPGVREVDEEEVSIRNSFISESPRQTMHRSLTSRQGFIDFPFDLSFMINLFDRSRVFLRKCALDAVFVWKKAPLRFSFIWDHFSLWPFPRWIGNCNYQFTFCFPAKIFKAVDFPEIYEDF